MMNRKIALPLLFLASLALLITGCGSDDDNPASPGAGTGGETLALDGEQAEQYTTGALDMVNGLVNTVPDFAEGDFTAWNTAKAEGDSIQWDPSQQAYTYAFEGPLFDLEPPDSWIMRLTIWLQYRDGSGDPLQYPLGATEMELRYTSGMTVHMEEDGGSADLDYDMDTNLVVGYLEEGDAYSISGSGSADYELSRTTSEGSASGRFGMQWTLDITASPDGCPSGTATVVAQDYVLEAVYDGQGGVSWTLAGNGYQAEGTDTVDCSPPVR